ncbi:hypothetical protein N473_19985 [Pseudoalteromonas luteoviolacea CPMOR-1]|uniref:Uncharacterized protein n=1 Tax=Pseudoalteromonas luteoviolacea CPMOR-1 TaxID=1365248 RepID=A0A162BHU9_9GAMM|nr:hypothetical protein N473_19985 [Pseudoalteromonas luteoviolacea CPMOR-1]
MSKGQQTLAFFFIAIAIMSEQFSPSAHLKLATM